MLITHLLLSISWWILLDSSLTLAVLHDQIIAILCSTASIPSIGCVCITGKPASKGKITSIVVRLAIDQSGCLGLGVCAWVGAVAGAGL